jgi:LacI family transcriptional regulator
VTIPRLRDVAQLAGVHTATASRALNPATRGLVREDTAARVLDAAARLGYTANPIARSLKTNRSNSIGVVIPDLTNALFPPIMRGIDDVLGPLGYSVLLVNTDNDK